MDLCFALRQEYNDVMLTSYLASMTKGLHSLNEVSGSFPIRALIYHTV